VSIEHPATIGIKAADLDTWLRQHPDDGPTLALRADLIAHRRNDVLALLPAAESGLGELATYLAARDDLKLPAAPGDLLALLGRTYAEDICILTPEGAQYLLSGAILCFPNRWRLADKAGKPILAVHAPVPDYAEKLSSQVDFFLGRLRPMRLFTRSNWGLVSTPTLHLPDPVAPVNPTADSNFFMRREDQSFVKLPGSGAVIFTIRTTVTPWAEVAPEDRTAILEQTKTLSTAWLRYKSMA
jgi:dimethylamine monooxygenase subunit A